MKENLCNHEIEHAILCACFLEQERITELSEADVTPAHFHDMHCQMIWTVIPRVLQQSGTADELIVIEYMRQHDVKSTGIRVTKAQESLTILQFVSLEKIHHITGIVETCVGFAAWLRTLKELHKAREFRQHLRDQIEAIEQTPSQTQDLIEHTASWLVNQNVETETTLANMESIAHEAYHSIVQARDGVQTNRVPTGLLDLDQHLRIAPGSMTVLAARPSMGKSALALNIAYNVATAGIPVLLFTLEMSNVDMGKRIIGTHARDNIKRFEEGLSRLSTRDLQDRAREVSELPIWMEEAVPMNVFRMRSTSRRMKLRENIGMIIIDYLQLADASTPNLSREKAIGEVSRNTKLMAKELNVPTIALSQLNREVEKRNPPRPLLSDLRDSGTIEQDADNVLFLSPTRQNVTTKKWEAGGRMILDIAKNRNGPTLSIDLTFTPQIMRFDNYAEEPNN